MAIKSVLEIDVKDDAFTKFKEKFDAYNQELTKVIGQNKNFVDGTQEWNERLAELLGDLQENLQKLAKEQRSMDPVLERQGRAWGSIRTAAKDVASDAKSIASSIYNATTSLLRWSAIAGVAGGLLGGGGLFGFTGLAGGVSGGRRSSHGLGLSYGEQKSFETNYGRLVEPHGFLSAVSGALSDVTQRGALYGAGLSENDIQGKNTAQVASALLPKLKELADRTPDQLLGNAISARGLGGLTSVEDLRRLRATSPEELSKIQGQYQQGVGAFGLEEDTQNKWQDFYVQMHRAGEEIENVFVKDLTALTVPLTDLSSSFSKAAHTLLSSPQLGVWIESFGHGIESAAKYIGTEKFQSDIRNFATGVSDLADVLGRVGARLHKWFGGEDQTKIPTSTSGETANLEPGQINALGLVRMLERSGDSAVSPKGAVGRYQITPDTARTYGLDPSKLKDPEYNTKAACIILRDLEKRYGGNLPEELVAYNAGPGVANKFRASGHNLNVLPSETRKYLERANDYLQKNQKVEIVVMNNTGGNANVTVNQTAGQ